MIDKFNDIFRYDGKKLYYKRWVNGRSKSLGLEAGSKQNGYLKVTIGGRNYNVHRVIWEMVNGEIPDGMEIDHINHVKDDNRIENLRLVTHKENSRNRKKRSDNSSGTQGVSLHKITGKWQSYCSNNDGTIMYLGLFEDINDAIEARVKFASQCDFHENHGK